jgi:hypothetical protein
MPIGNCPYPSPGTPEYQEWKKQYDAEQKQQQECSNRWQEKMTVHDKASENYHRNVFAISLSCGLLFVILCLFLRPSLDFVKPGLFLGGIATIIYAIAQTDLADKFRFIGIAVGLVVVFYVGYRTLLERKPAS